MRRAVGRNAAGLAAIAAAYAAVIAAAHALAAVIR